MEKFRKLRANEIDCRVSQINEKGLTLLLYKDARVDQNILDETVGPMNWQREHRRANANCIVSIWDKEKGQWIRKEDTGTESKTEAEKGLASDSFKRACFNWGIGRELYTAPFIWVPAGNYQGFQDKGKWKTYDRFQVTEIDYDSDGNICALAVINEKTKKKVYEFGARRQPEATGNSAPEHITAKEWKTLQGVCKEKDIDPEEVLTRYGYKKPSEVTVAMYCDMIEAIEEGKL